MPKRQGNPHDEVADDGAHHAEGDDQKNYKGLEVGAEQRGHDGEDRQHGHGKATHEPAHGFFVLLRGPVDRPMHVRVARDQRVEIVFLEFIDDLGPRDHFRVHFGHYGDAAKPVAARNAGIALFNAEICHGH